MDRGGLQERQAVQGGFSGALRVLETLARRSQGGDEGTRQPASRPRGHRAFQGEGPTLAGAHQQGAAGRDGGRGERHSRRGGPYTSTGCAVWTPTLKTRL